MAKGNESNQPYRGKRQRFLKKLVKIKRREKVKSWCDCIGTNPGNYQVVTQTNDVCDLCGFEVQWDTQKPRPSDSTKDIEVHFLDDYVVSVPSEIDFFYTENTEDTDAI